jgi:hypothetical protein
MGFARGWKALLLLVCVFITTACGQFAMEINPLHLQSSSGPSISGMVASSLLSASNVKALDTSSCTSQRATVALYKLDSSGKKILPALATTEAQSNGFYQFSSLESLGVSVSSTGELSGSYVVEARRCENVLKRFVTTLAKQDIHVGSTLVSNLLNTTAATSLLAANRQSLSELMAALSAQESFSAAYAALSTVSDGASLLQRTIGVTPTTLQDAAPEIASANVPDTAREGATLALMATASHWRSDYPFAYVWKLDGTTIGTTATLNHALGGNAQGAHTIKLLQGQVGSGGGLDLTKPYSSMEFSLSVSDDRPAQPPTFTLVGSSSVHQPAIRLSLNTGENRSACDTFSGLILTENSSAAPSAAATFPITCSTELKQVIDHTLTTGTGAKTLRLWAKDAAGNVSATSTSINFDYTIVTPVIQITAPVILGSYQTTVSISGTCDSTAGDLSFGGDTTSTSAACVGGLFSKEITLSGAEGLKHITLSQTNDSGTTGSAALEVYKDVTAPSVILATTATNPTALAVIPVTVSFSEAVAGLSPSSFNVMNASIQNFAGSGASYTLELVPASEGQVSISMPAGGARDAAGNLSTASFTLARLFDSRRPTATLTSNAPELTNAAIVVSLVFSENITGLTASGLDVTNGTLSSISGSGTAYSFTLTPSGNGVVSVRVKDGAAQDGAGNTNVASSVLSRTFDGTLPTATLASTAPSSTNTSPIPVTVTFSEPVTGFGLSSVSVTNGKAASLSGSGSAYTFSVTPNTNGTVSVSLLAGAAHDAAGNTSQASTALSRDFSTSQPIVTLATTAGAFTKTLPIPVTVEFSASVADFDSSDVSITNGTISGFSGSGTSYSFAITGSAQGAVTVSVPEGAAHDASTNANLASNSLSLVYDSVAPLLSVVVPETGSFINQNNQSNFVVHGTCNETDGSVQLTLGALSASAKCSGENFDSSFDATSLGEGDVALTVNLSDAAGNAATQKSISLTKDSLAPTATLTGALSGVSRITDLNVTVGGTDVATYRYKIGSTDSTNCSVTSDYFSLITSAVPITDNVSALAEGSVTLCVLGRDAAGNSQATATVATWVKDTLVSPFTQLTLAPTSPASNTKPSVSGQVEPNAIVQLYALPSCLGPSVGDTTAGTNGAFTVTPGSSLGNNGPYGLSALATDSAGNTLCSDTLLYTLDTAAPTVTLTSVTSEPTATNPIPVTVKFNENVTGFTSSDVSVTHAVLADFTGAGQTYTFTLTPTGDPTTVTAQIAAGAARDEAGNASSVSNTFTRHFDSTVPDPSRPKLVITTALESAATTLSFKNLDCTGKSGLIIRETPDLPGSTDSDWQSCAVGDGAVTYTLSSTKMGYRPLYAWSKDSAGHISAMKTIPFTYAPRVSLGADQPLLESNSLGSFASPQALDVIGTKLLIGDNNRVAVWNQLPTTNHQTQDYVVGTHRNDLSTNNYNGITAQSFYNPYSIAHETVGGVTTVAVADYSNNRVLLYHSIPTLGQAADVVLGQPDFNSAVANIEGITDRTLKNPFGVAISGGKLYVSDCGNHRVLIWNSIPTTNFTRADHVLGQPSMNSGTSNNGGVSAQSLNGPRQLTVAGGMLFVADSSNNRVLIWSTLPTTDQAPATYALGQPNLISNTANNGGISKSSLYGPRSVASDGTKLVVTDGTNYRVLVWNTLPAANKATADIVIGQANDTSNGANQGGAPSATGFNVPMHAVLDGAGHLWVADRSNNRVVRFTEPLSSGMAADLVLGQQSLSNQNRDWDAGVSTTLLNNPNRALYQKDAQGNDHFLVLDSRHSRVLHYSANPTANMAAADQVFGQADFVSSVSNRGLNGPAQSTIGDDARDILWVGTKFYLADCSNNRILGWNNFDGNLNAAPDFVLGQPDFVSLTANNGGISAKTLACPARLATDGTRLAVSDVNNNRVLIWSSLPTTTQQAASVVLGQPDMSSNTANNGGISDHSLNGAQGILFKDNRLLIADRSNHRILIWNSIPKQNQQKADLVLGQPDFTTALTSGRLATTQVYLPNSMLVMPNGSLVVNGTSPSGLMVWKQIPSVNNAPADQIYRSNRLILSMPEGTKAYLEPNVGSVNTISTDGTRVFASISTDRVEIFAIPTVSLVGGIYLSSSPSGQITVHDCFNYTKMLVNEGSEPAANDTGWRACSTTPGGLPFTVSSASGYHQLKVWFKDDDGLVLPHPRMLDFFLDQTPPQAPPVNLVTGAGFSSSTISIPFTTCTEVADIYISESPTPPSAASASWQSCVQAGLPYTLNDTTDGTKTLYVWSRDIAGNISVAPRQITITLDAVAPSTAPAATLSEEHIGTLSYLYFTMNDCMDAAYVFVTEGAKPAATDSGWVACSTATNLLPLYVKLPTTGTHNFNIWSKDAAGNVSTNPRTITRNYNFKNVLGQADDVTVSSAATGLNYPRGMAYDPNSGRFAVADNYNGRVLIFNSLPTNPAKTPDLVLGQTDLKRTGSLATNDSANAGVTAANLRNPNDVLFVGEKLIVADYNSSRVLIWNSIPTYNNQPADVVIGQTSLIGTSSGVTNRLIKNPYSLASDGTNLVVSDYSTHRVLIWNKIPTANYAPADVVLGQPDFTSSAVNAGGAISASTLNYPRGVKIHNGRLYVADASNNRILIWNTIPTTNFAAASRVLGQTSFTTGTTPGTQTNASLYAPTDIEVVGTGGAAQIYVADYGNKRILVWDTYPSADGEAAVRVLGQASFSATLYGTCSGLEILDSPTSVLVVGDTLWSNTTVCHAIVGWNSLPTETGVGRVHDWVWGAPSAGIRGRYDPNAVRAVSASSLVGPRNTSFASDGKMYIADTLGNRILGWNSAPATANAPADFILGQDSTSSITANNSSLAENARFNRPAYVQVVGTKFIVADSKNNRVLLYEALPTHASDGATRVLGQSSFTGVSANRGGSAASNTLNGPMGVYFDGTRLFVADTGNHRVLIWNSWPTVDGQAADVVIGQTSFTGTSGTITSSRLNTPSCVYSTGSVLLVCDTANDRVLVWKAIENPTTHALTLTNGKAADLVIGQANFTTDSTSAPGSNLNGPYDLALISGRLYIADAELYRIVSLDASVLSGTTNGPSFTGLLGKYAINQTLTSNYYGLTAWSYHYPSGITTDPAGNLWVTDQRDHRALQLDIFH